MIDENEEKMNQIHPKVKKITTTEKFIENHESAPKWKKKIFWICGIDSLLRQEQLNKNSSDIERKSKISKVDTSIHQDRFWSIVCDINAIIAMALCGFCYGFFNKFN
jgi:hypothetical protein